MKGKKNRKNKKKNNTKKIEKSQINNNLSANLNEIKIEEKNESEIKLQGDNNKIKVLKISWNVSKDPNSIFPDVKLHYEDKNIDKKDEYIKLRTFGNKFVEVRKNIVDGAEDLMQKLLVLLIEEYKSKLSFKDYINSFIEVIDREEKIKKGIIKDNVDKIFRVIDVNIEKNETENKTENETERLIQNNYYSFLFRLNSNKTIDTYGQIFWFSVIFILEEHNIKQNDVKYYIFYT